ncbi:MAG: hypothetical protein PVJ98_04010 [Akkermansiaceae bacterium]|jgi:hypothetical protein
MSSSPRKTPSSLPDFDPGIENDAVWNLLDEASPAEVSPRFADDTLRRLRLESETRTPWWKAIFAPKPMIATAATALAAIAIVVSLPNNDPAPVTAPVVEVDQPTSEDWENLEDSLAQELLSRAAEDPTLLSDEEIVALLY